MSEIVENQKSATKKQRLQIFQTIAEDSDSGNSEPEKLHDPLSKAKMPPIEEVKAPSSYMAEQLSRVLRINTTNPTLRSSVHNLSAKQDGYIGYDLIGGIFSIHMHSEKDATSLKLILGKTFPFLSVEYERSNKSMEYYASLTTPHPANEFSTDKQYNPYLNCTQCYFPSLTAHDNMDQVPEE
jgi:hypothetical protein